MVRRINSFLAYEVNRQNMDGAEQYPISVALRMHLVRHPFAQE